MREEIIERLTTVASEGGPYADEALRMLTCIDEEGIALHSHAAVTVVLQAEAHERWRRQQEDLPAERNGAG